VLNFISHIRFMDDALDRAEVGELAAKTVMLSFEHIDANYTYTLLSTG
jgi:hypothetical protein